MGNPLLGHPLASESSSDSLRNIICISSLMIWGMHHMAGKWLPSMIALIDFGHQSPDDHEPLVNHGTITLTWQDPKVCVSGWPCLNMSTSHSKGAQVVVFIGTNLINGDMVNVLSLLCIFWLTWQCVCNQLHLPCQNTCSVFSISCCLDLYDCL